MHQDIAQSPPTSNGATKETEPEVVAAIASGEGGPNLPLTFRSGRVASGFGGPLLLLAAGLALGYGASRWMHAWR